MDETQNNNKHLGKKELAKKIPEHRCPTCKQLITYRERQGFIYYARPCGHRLGL